MCGRYELHANPAVIALVFGLQSVPEFLPRYNIAPMTDVPVVRLDREGNRELIPMRWGLVPRFAKSPSIGAKMINARSEAVATNAAYRSAYRYRRCLLPASGFYEWKATPGGKRPVHVAMRDGAPFGLAGLYERWKAPDGQVLRSCAILTTEANPLLAPVHDRMPVIIPPEAYARWLDPDVADPAELLRAYPDELLTAHPVSTRVNQAANDGSELIEPQDE